MCCIEPLNGVQVSFASHMLTGGTCNIVPSCDSHSVYICQCLSVVVSFYPLSPTQGSNFPVVRPAKCKLKQPLHWANLSQSNQRMCNLQWCTLMVSCTLQQQKQKYCQFHWAVLVVWSKMISGRVSGVLTSQGQEGDLPWSGWWHEVFSLLGYYQKDGWCGGQWEHDDDNCLGGW